MKIFLKITFILISLNVYTGTYSQNCTNLINGDYEMYYDTNQKSVGTFKIRGGKYLQLENNLEVIYDIIDLSSCSFELHRSEKIDESKLTEVQKLLMKQKSYFEILRVEGNVYYFICRVNLHINCGTGKFIKIK